MISLFLDSEPGMIFPNHLIGWLGWLLMAAVLVWGLWKYWERPDWLRNRWWLFLAFLAATPLFTGFLGLRLPVQMQLMPDTPLDVSSPALMVLAAVPWVMAGGLLGPQPAVFLGILSGLLLAVYETHNPFTPLEIGLLAFGFSIAQRQNYRTLFYRLIRHPLIGILITLLAYIPLLMISGLFSTNGSLAVRLDYTFTQTWMIYAARTGELLIAGLIGEMVVRAFPNWWGRKLSLVPSPTERNIQTRFLFGAAPLVATLILTLVVGDWLVAGNAATRMIRDRLSSTAEVAAESLPYFLETGQNLILTLSTPDLLTLPPNELPNKLAGQLRSVPYFRQFYLFNAAGQPVSGFPVEDAEQLNLSAEEKSGVNLALKGVSTQIYIVPPVINETSAQVSFIAAIRENGEVKGAMIGRTDLNTNPFTQPAIQALDGISDMSGVGMILNEKGQILYHPLPSQVMNLYPGKLPENAAFYDETSSSNARQFVYYQPVTGRNWAVVLTVPAKIAQQMALEIAFPLLIMLFVLGVLSLVFLRLGLHTVTASLHDLSQEATLIARGQLDHSLPSKGVDEVGMLSQAFEQMRSSLKARLEELNSLLKVSQGVAANLDIREAVQPILQAALIDDAAAARLVLVRDVTLDTVDRSPVVFGVGPDADLYAGLDQQLFDLLRHQEILSLPNLGRSRRLQFEPGAARPGALLAITVRHESRYYGVLWVAYSRARNFPEEQIRFLTTLSSEAALAATSARLYATAEVGRQRLEAVLASTPEPVLVIDEQSRLLLLNPAAVQVPDLILSSVEGKPIQDVVGSPELADLLVSPLKDRASLREIVLSNGRVYYASASLVLAEGRSVGKVCILRDITHFKELEQLKSDFVATVSHDLRSPLTLMRGYATMLQMVGDLNEQQKGYVRKIVSGVENMTKLVNNLLDLGRIETGVGLKIERVAVNEVMDEVINSLQLQAVQKDIHLTPEMIGPVEKFAVEADRALLQQALVNLVENAIKYTAVGGTVKTRLQSRSNSVLVEVQDSGIGIAPLDLPHLFEKFYRSGRREASQQRGTGLGLTIVKSIAERHGGRVWVDSQLGKGSVFSLEIPCEQSQKVEEEVDLLS